MIKLRNLEELKAHRNVYGTSTLGFVPTMGALHEGHLSLIKKAQKECERVCVSIFVNPTQFNDPKDYETYPNNLEKDFLLLENAEVDCVWLPQKHELYPDQYTYQIKETLVSPLLCGQTRPGHFEGMLTIVLKLLQIVQAKRAYFGEKDYQQLLLVKGLVKAFFINTEIVACPIERDACGLALSSRNQKLSPQGLFVAQKFAKQFELDIDKTKHEAHKNLEKIEGLKVDYLEDNFFRRFVAVLIDNIRLIDNRPLPQNKNLQEGMTK